MELRHFQVPEREEEKNDTGSVVRLLAWHFRVSNSISPPAWPESWGRELKTQLVAVLLTLKVEHDITNSL